MPSAVVSVTTGAMNPLIGKLAQLLGEEYTKLTAVRKQAAFLRDELGATKALLDKMELMDKLDPTAKNWRDRVREMSYDMENCIDDFMHNSDRADGDTSFVSKMAEFLAALAGRHQIADQVEEADARRGRYKVGDGVDSSHVDVAVDPRISAIYKGAEGLVGIDGPREELVGWLMDLQKELKVVSIVGLGGSGKTTLAKQVYDKIEGQFDCTTFVSVSRRSDVESLLNGLLFNLGMGEYSRTLELHDIIDSLREHLKHERYFILIDDLWDQSAWNIIRCAFPENSNGSRMIVTTRLDDVAINVCQNDHAWIYRMKQLEEQDSRRLFFNRVFGSENVCPPQFQDISAEILKKCGGLPLAVIMIASLLASHEARSLNEWQSINNYLGPKFATEPTLEEMKGILSVSYMHLSVHLWPCLLYLGMYPEDCEIWRGDLVKQWIAEGFICSMHGVDLYDVANSYFNELINRSLIKPERIEYGEVLSCRVHDMMLDFILSKSIEDNFITVAYKYGDMARLQSCEYKVCRLSLKSSAGSAESKTLSTSMSQVRSYARFGVSRYLKVLALTAGVELPTEIQGLVHLETLELVCYRTQSFPSDITRLVNLFHLILPDGTVLPKGIQNMKSVRTLHCSGMAESSLEDIKGLSQLTNLKELELSTHMRDFLTVERVDALVSSIGLLRDLKHLTLDCDSECDGYDRQLDSLPDPPLRLEVLDLEGWQFSRVPRWIGELSCLRFLHLFVLHLSSDDVRVLGELPCLFNARFHVSDISQDKVIIGTGLFPVLENLWFRSDEDVSAYLSFEAGAMPKLKKLTLGFGWKQWRGATPVGMECLPCLQDIRVWLRDSGPESSKNREDIGADVESAFKRAVLLHPRHPSITID